MKKYIKKKVVCTLHSNCTYVQISMYAPIVSCATATEVNVHIYIYTSCTWLPNHITQCCVLLVHRFKTIYIYTCKYIDNIYLYTVTKLHKSSKIVY